MAKVLVVDDDKMIHTLVRGALEKNGMKVHSAFDSVQAPMMARQVAPDLIILDIKMPGGGGFQTFRRLQMMGTTNQIPVLVLTSVAEDVVRQEIPPAPNVALLLKPASPEQILAAVRSLLPSA